MATQSRNYFPIYPCTTTPHGGQEETDSRPSLGSVFRMFGGQSFFYHTARNEWAGEGGLNASAQRGLSFVTLADGRMINSTRRHTRRRSMASIRTLSLLFQFINSLKTNTRPADQPARLVGWLVRPTLGVRLHACGIRLFAFPVRGRPPTVIGDNVAMFTRPGERY